MIFVGDIALPYLVRPLFGAMPWSQDDAVIGNLEGAFLESEEIPQWELCNSRASEDVMKSCGITAVTLANNHIMDLKGRLEPTIKWLNGIGVRAFGAGLNSQLASKPLFIVERGTDIGLIGFGWHVIGCVPAGINKAGCNGLNGANVLRCVKEFKDSFPEKKLVLFMHWDYELEVYPQPMHRQLACNAIDMGASAVVGCHSHCIQGIEYYRNAPIVYGLGNWFLAEGVFKAGHLKFPGFSKLQMAFEWRGSASEDKVHLFRFDPETHQVTYVSSRPVVDSNEISALSDFAGMDHQEYIAWFKKNRRKKKLLPVYRNYDAAITNWIFDNAVWARQQIINGAVFLNLKRGPQ